MTTSGFPYHRHRGDKRVVPWGCAAQATLLLGALFALLFASLLLATQDQSPDPPAGFLSVELEDNSQPLSRQEVLTGPDRHLRQAKRAST